MSGSSLRPVSCSDDDVDNISCVIAYADGSTGTLIYGTQGDPKIGKEYLEVHGGGQTAIVSNFTKLELICLGARKPMVTRYNGDKGQAEQMKAFAESIVSGGPLPVSYAEIVQTTRLTLLAGQATRFGRASMSSARRSRRVQCLKYALVAQVEDAFAFSHLSQVSEAGEQLSFVLAGEATQQDAAHGR